MPATPLTPGNVTWTISSNDPPAVITNTPIVPQVEELVPIPYPVFNPSQRQIGVGEYVFNLSYSDRSLVGEGTKYFTPGQTLEFNQVSTSPLVNQLLVPNVVDLQQNNNTLDIFDMGLTQEEINRLNTSTRTTLNNLITSLNSAVANVNNLAVQISDNQKSLNETQKTYIASSTSLGPEDEITQKLQARVTTLTQQQTALTAQYNAAQEIANEQYTQILQVKELVK